MTERVYVWIALWTLTFGATGINDFLVSLSGVMYSPLVCQILTYVDMGQALVGLIFASAGFTGGFQVGPVFVILGELASLTAGTFKIIAMFKKPAAPADQSTSQPSI